MSETGGSPAAKKGRRTEHPHRIAARLSDEEWEQFAAIRDALRRSGRMGHLSVSETLRAIIMLDASELASIPECALSGEDIAARAAAMDAATAALEGVRTQVRRIGTNFNQLTRLAHQTGQMPHGFDQVADQLQIISRRLDAIDDAVVGVSYGLEWELEDVEVIEVVA